MDMTALALAKKYTDSQRLAYTTTETRTRYEDLPLGIMEENFEADKFKWDIAKTYSDGGDTEFEGIKGPGVGTLAVSQVFDYDTLVTVRYAFGTVNGNMKQYLSCIPDGATAEDYAYSGSVYYMQMVGSASTNITTIEYLVRAGHRLAFINYNTSGPHLLELSANVTYDVEVVHPVDPKYLPGGIGYSSEKEFTATITSMVNLITEDVIDLYTVSSVTVEVGGVATDTGFNIFEDEGVPVILLTDVPGTAILVSVDAEIATILGLGAAGTYLLFQSPQDIDPELLTKTIILRMVAEGITKIDPKYLPKNENTIPIITLNCTVTNWVQGTGDAQLEEEEKSKLLIAMERGTPAVLYLSNLDSKIPAGTVLAQFNPAGNSLVPTNGREETYEYIFTVPSRVGYYVIGYSATQGWWRFTHVTD